VNIKQIEGNTTLEFSDEEIKILIKYKKLTFDPINSKHFFNSMMWMLVKMQEGLDEKSKKITTPLEKITNSKGLDIDATNIKD
tara:strand:+ start:3207 stop:3455 length:249 start_codon:yes stop_codon:yes gene_type:complete